jgi:hypothetical protein
VSSSCLVVKGALDVTPLGLGCAAAGVRGSRSVAGNFIANADGTYVDQTVTSGEEIIDLPEACLSISGTLVTCDRVGPVFESFGYDSVTCVSDGGGCQCGAVFEQTSGLGVLSIFPSSNGTYETSGSVMTLVSQEATTTRYQYCVSGDQLTVLPTSDTDSLRGTIVLARQ